MDRAVALKRAAMERMILAVCQLKTADVTMAIMRRERFSTVIWSYISHSKRCVDLQKFVFSAALTGGKNAVSFRGSARLNYRG